MLKVLLCKLNISHKWHVEHAEDGSLGAVSAAERTTMSARGEAESSAAG